MDRQRHRRWLRSPDEPAAAADSSGRPELRIHHGHLNVGACTLLIPLGISIASQIGVDPRVAAIVVGLGVSNSFILPTHQVNALYMGPGEYRTRDYIRIGGGLAIIYIIILVAMTYFFYL